MSSEQQLRDLIDERVAAVHAKDPGPLAARQHPDVVSFNVLPPLTVRGSEAVQRQTQDWFDAYPGPIGYEVSDVAVEADGDLGWCRFVYHVSGTLATGDDVDMWVRASLTCRRVDGEWLIVHDHESVPFDPSTGQALLDLAP